MACDRSALQAITKGQLEGYETSHHWPSFYCDSAERGSGTLRKWVSRRFRISSSAGTIRRRLPRQGSHPQSYRSAIPVRIPAAGICSRPNRATSGRTEGGVHGRRSSGRGGAGTTGPRVVRAYLLPKVSTRKSMKLRSFGVSFLLASQTTCMGCEGGT